MRYFTFVKSVWSVLRYQTQGFREIAILKYLSH